MRRVATAGVLTWTVLAWWAGAGPATAAAQAPPGARVRALFLGDNGHHRPADGAKSVLPSLSANGIDLVYTDDPADLDTAVLRQYHALVLYNNHPSVSAAQLGAVLQFLEQGGGMVVLHCASPSFQNSEAFIRVVGAAFKSHGTGTVRTTRLVPDHPALRDVPPFESWDETYLHTKHNPDRVVLEVRTEGGHREPWTWVRNHGAGRVFYTAWGHDQRTWGTPGFQQLFGRAIQSPAGDWALGRRPDPAAPVITLAAPRPLYEPPPAPWNTLKGFVDTAQAPLPPEASYPLMTARPGFRIEPFAAEPLVRHIIDFAWDERGRLWAVETNDYPNRLLPDGAPGGDRVLILEDTTGDGRADRVKVFADGLNLATSLVFGGGGLIVAQPPHMLLLRDTDGDDRADERRILFSGFPREDTHGSVSNLRYGFDNQVWGSVGYNGFRGEVGGVTFGRGPGRILMGAGYFRFAPDGAWLDYVARTSNNTWGLGLSEEGDAFGSTANRSASQYVAVPGRFYRELVGQTPTLRSIADREDVFPLRQIYQVDQFGLYTAGTAHEIYTARDFPREYWNRAAFVADPTAHLVGMFELIPDGSGFRAKNRWSLMASRDGWQAPVQVKVGPDGALWVSDFYTLIAQHNPTPQGMQRGPGNAYDTPNRTNDYSRLYRIAYQGATPPGTTSLAGATPERLVAALADDNMFWRLTAQRLLVGARPARRCARADPAHRRHPVGPGGIESRRVPCTLDLARSRGTSGRSGGPRRRAPRAASPGRRGSASGAPGAPARWAAAGRHLRRRPSARSFVAPSGGIHRRDRCTPGRRRPGAAGRVACRGGTASVAPRCRGGGGAAARAAQRPRPLAGRRRCGGRRPPGARRGAGPAPEPVRAVRQRVGRGDRPCDAPHVPPLRVPGQCGGDRGARGGDTGGAP